MDKNKIEEYKSKLVEEKEKLDEEIKKLSVHVDMGDEPGFQDESNESEDTYNRRGEIITLKRRKTDIESALIRIQREQYGKCIACGVDIENELLSVDPASLYCLICSKKINKGTQ